ncbi:Carbohydrate sulfotransferase 5 [Armadillidium vulgare]|nr:Carbohydrate sulfotransferase 5 [Armadillidium vulgare]
MIEVKQPNFDLMHTVNSGIDKRKYRNVKSDDKSKYKGNSEKLVLNHAKYNIQKPLTEILKAPSYENIFKQLIVLNKIFIKKIFSKERKDVDFLPGERVPTDKVRRVLIVSTWRSGSTFLGDIFNSYPAAFYSFEPLHMKYRNKHLQKGEDIAEALSFIKDIFTCNITFHHEYMKYLREYQYVLVHNKFMWNSCYANRAYCFDPNFMSQICQLTPLNVMKTVRLGLLPVDKLLSDKTLNLKVIHLVRDPRGSLHSRIKLPWCKSKICRDPKTVCDSLYTDLKLSDSFLKKYPERFQVIRYEDLSLNPRNVSEKILQFAGLHFHRGTENFLKEHTELDDSKRNHKKIGAYTTFRDSQKTPFHWRESFSFPQTNYIQKMCKKALDVLGFRVFRSPSDYMNKNISILMNS